MATAAVTPKATLYKNFLTPALHRRFTGAALIVLLICYLEAVLIGAKTSCECAVGRRSFIQLRDYSPLVLVPNWHGGHKGTLALCVGDFGLRPSRCTSSPGYERA